MILVTGATGKVGRHLVADLLAAGAPVRALTRDPAAAGLPAAAEVAAFESARPDPFAAAMTGVTAVFVNMTAVGGSISELVSAATAAGVRALVMLSSFTVRDDGPQEYAMGAHHKAAEDAITATSLDWTLLRCGGFAANTLAWAPSIRQAGLVRAPYGDAATALIAEQDVAAAAAAVLLDASHARFTHVAARYILTGGESLTQVEQAQIIGAAIGRPIQFEELPADTFRLGAAGRVPEAVVEDMLRYHSRYVGQIAEMSPDLEKLTGRPAITFADWVSDHAASFR